MFYQIRIKARDADRRIRTAGFYNGYHNTPRAVKRGYDGLVTVNMSPRKLARILKNLSRDLENGDIDVSGPFRTNPTRGKRKSQ